MRWPKAKGSIKELRAIKVPQQSDRDFKRLATCWKTSEPGLALAGAGAHGARVVPAAPGTDFRALPHAHRRPGPAGTMSQQFPSRERFLTELTLDPPNATSDLSGKPRLDEEFLVLSTVHSAKGMEWDTVYVLNVVDGSFPNEFSTGKQEMIDEERRLLYVAMTRARNELQLISPLEVPADPAGAAWRRACVWRAQPLHVRQGAAGLRAVQLCRFTHWRCAAGSGRCGGAGSHRGRRVAPEGHVVARQRARAESG